MSAQLSLFATEPVARRQRAPRHPLVACLRGDDLALYRECRDYRRGFIPSGGDSTGMCFMISLSLQGWLSYSLKLETELLKLEFEHDDASAFGWAEHYVLRRLDGTIIDATGDQFNRYGAALPDVYIGPMPEIYARWMARQTPAHPESALEGRRV